MSEPLASRSLRLLADLLEKHTGQRVAATRSWRIESALQPVMREWGILDVDALAAVVAAGTEPLLARACVEAMLNNETSFFRDQAAFALLTGPALTELRHARSLTRRLRLWSAACSTGQEPLSLAMTVLDEPEKWAGWSIEIVGTDISTAAIARARSGRYSQFEIQRGLPASTMLRWFRQEGEEWVADPQIKRMVSYREHNLLDPALHLGRFDAILCRNMLMYLDPERRSQVFDRLADAIQPDGVLMLGAAETILGQTDRFVASEAFRGLYTSAAAQRARRLATA